MSGREYIAKVYQQLSSPEYIKQSHYKGAFLQAALAVVEAVESPLKEQTLVRLAVLELAQERTDIRRARRAAAS
jgi:hypothetical protein